jgi:protein-S-isoprenylcysteine O-methyltransferase Ste14
MRQERRLRSIGKESLKSNDKSADKTLSRLKMGGLGVLTTLLYLWLAVRGSGGWTAFFRHPARTGVAVASVLMASAAFCSDANLSSGEREDRSNRWVLLPLLAIGLLSGFLPAYTERKGWWILDGDIVRWLGFSLYVSGGALRIAPVFVLGRRFSGLVAIQPGHELVTDGIYGTVRHPSYLGLIIMGFGWALTFRSGAGVVLAGLVIPPTLARIRSEEALLRSQFGEQYDSYRRGTSRLIPGLY